MIGYLVIGAIPMANILAFGLLIYLRGQGKLRFLLGFETFGTVALAIYVFGLVLFTNELITPLNDNFTKCLISRFRDERFQDGLFINKAELASLYSVTIAILTLPQVAFALLGGLLFQTVAKYISPSQAGSSPSDDR